MPDVGRPKVLIVDDEPGIVEVLTFSLEEAGFEALVAVDGPTALRRALTEAPSLVLLDIMLPGLDGLAVCREIRLVSDMPIILLTAKGSEADRIAGLELHADDYVVQALQRPGAGRSYSNHPSSHHLRPCDRRRERRHRGRRPVARS